MFFRILSVLAFLGLSQAFADLDLTGLIGTANEDIKAVIKTFALGGDYKAVHYATPEGLIIGLDVGIEITAIKIDDKFKNALTKMGDNPAGDIPGYLPLPRLNFTKGLPMGFDVGFSILKIKQQGINILNYGGSLKYAILPGGPAIPAVAVRGTFHRGEYFDKIKTSTYGIEGLASMNFLFVQPFAGLGFQTGKGEFDESLPGSVGLDLKPSVSQVRFFVGATLQLAFFHIAAEADFGSEIKTYSTKLSLNF